MTSVIEQKKIDAQKAEAAKLAAENFKYELDMYLVAPFLVK